MAECGLTIIGHDLAVTNAIPRAFDACITILSAVPSTLMPAPIYLVDAINFLQPIFAMLIPTCDVA